MKKESENNEKDVDKIFNEFKDKKLGRVIKRARWQTILRNIAISFLVFCVLFFMVSYFISSYASRHRTSTYNYTFALNSISAPDKYLGVSVQKINPYWSKNEYTTYKIIEEKVVYTGTMEDEFFPLSLSNPMIAESCPPIMDYTFTHTEIEYTGCRRFNEFGQRVMVFFYPFVKYDAGLYLNDLDYLDDIADDKYIEMALSFDREYTIEDAEKMLPESITVTWYWIDDLSGNEKEFLKIPRAEQLEMEQPIYIPYVRSEYTAYGIKLHYNNGVMINDPAESFINVITERMTEFQKGNEFERIHSNIAGNNGELTKDDIKIWGAVVTGDPESLKVLAGLPFIRASSLGVVTDKY